MPTVLVIDENRAALDTIGRVLRSAGFNVALASTGQRGAEARASACDRSRRGRSSTRRISRTSKCSNSCGRSWRIPVIVTGLASTASAIEAGKLGAVDYIEKPVFRGSSRPSRPRHTCRAVGRKRRRHKADPGQSSSHSDDAVIEKRYVETTLQVGAVAQDLGVSTEHLCRVIKRHTG